MLIYPTLINNLQVAVFNHIVKIHQWQNKVKTLLVFPLKTDTLWTDLIQFKYKFIMLSVLIKHEKYRRSWLNY